MDANPLLGIGYHWLGGLAAGSFYVAFRPVKQWSWETFWLVGGVFSWLLAPWVMAVWLTSDIAAVLREAPVRTLFWSYFFGVLWGLGGLTFGLTVRYLGMSLGVAVVLGYCAAFGTLIPPIFNGEFGTRVLGSTSGLVILAGIGVCLLGIVVAGLAGISKERELPEAQKLAVIQEFNLRKGLGVATFSGIMSACFSYALAAGDPIREITVRHGTDPLWQGLPVLVVVLLGGFTTNAVWCLVLNFRNRTWHEYFGGVRAPVVEAGEESLGATEGTAAVAVRSLPATERAPLLSNYFFCALAGVTWYFQFCFYTMGETQMGAYKFSSWTMHMASIIIFSTLWGIALREWRGVSTRTKMLVTLSLLVLIGSTLIVGYGNYLGAAG